MDDKGAELPSVNVPARKPLGTAMRWGCLFLVGVFALCLLLLAIGSTIRKPEKKPPNPEVHQELTTKVEKPQDAASIYAERVHTYWLPEARSLPSTLPADEAQIGLLLTKIDGLVANVRDGSMLTLSKDQSRGRSALISVLASRQNALLPAMRSQYAKALDAKLFRRDIRVMTVGTRSTSLRFTGAVFSFNANVEDMQTEMRPIVRRLRFAKVEYRWNPYIRDGLRYDLEPPGDAELGWWNGDSFDRVMTPTRPTKRDPACVPELAKSVGLTC